MTQRLLLIDNYDSFTYNLVQAFRSLGAETLVFRNDEITLQQAQQLAPTHLVISPGPGRPEGAGVSCDMIRAFAGKVPVLGVCLGHQSIVSVFGGEVVSARQLMHGKTSMVEHDSEGLYRGLAVPMEVGRYHSLAARAESIPECLQITSRTEDGEIMGVRHRRFMVEGVQFHPESVLTPDGPALMRNFLEFAAGVRSA
jgi:anthranilate synthase/aminodeoxychorismate synthase-like glutamine amidotransferase